MTAVSIEDLDERVERLETWKHQQEVLTALAEQNRKHADERFDRLEKRLDKIETSMAWIVKLILGTIVGAILTYVIQGGLVIS